MEAMLAVPDRKSKQGRGEYALWLYLYNTGARVSEAAQLKVRDLQIGRGKGGHDLATVHGKGGKTRQCPLLAGNRTGSGQRSSVVRSMTPYSSAGSERRLLASESIALSSVARPGRQDWLAER